MNGTPNRCSCGAEEPATSQFDIESVPPPAGVRLMRCPTCGSLYPDRLPIGGGAYRDYYTLAPPRAGWRRWTRAVADSTRRAYVDRATPSGARRVLDFGCGAGDFLTRATAEGRACFGTDLTAPGRSATSWVWLDLDQVASAAPFDWITLGHVLEHVNEPASLVGRLAAMLTPGGGLWIATPNADSFVFRVAGAGARDVDYPRHREIFARAGLQRLLATAGLNAAFTSPPRINAVLNVLTTARTIRRSAGRSQFRRAADIARTILALLAHLLKPRDRRDQESPELVAVCTISPEGSSQAR